MAHSASRQFLDGYAVVMDPSLHYTVRSANLEIHWFAREIFAGVYISLGTPHAEDGNTQPEHD